MSIEIMLNAVNISLIAFDRYLNLHDGQVFSFMVMCVAAAEVSVGLAIIISLVSQQTYDKSGRLQHHEILRRKFMLLKLTCAGASIPADWLSH